MRDKIIAALKEEVALLEHASVKQIDTHIYAIEKILDILKSEDKVPVERTVKEAVHKQESKEHKSDSIFDF